MERRGSQWGWSSVLHGLVDHQVQSLSLVTAADFVPEVLRLVSVLFDRAAHFCCYRVYNVQLPSLTSHSDLVKSF